MDLAKQAIDAALSRDWKKAISINTQILKSDSKNIEALNRLGRALFETGLKTKAATIYSKVLRLDKFNSIAQKNIELIKKSRVSHNHKLNLPPVTAMFIEEPGTTKTVNLIRVGDPKIVSRLRPGDPLLLVARDYCVTVLTPQKEHIGRLPDDLSSRLGKLIKGGNKYSAYVKSLDPLKVFIIESYKATAFLNIVSFPPTEKLTYTSFTPPELIHAEKPDIAPPEEDVETPAPAIDNLDMEVDMSIKDNL